MVVTGTHNPSLVALSILVASFASYTALDLGGHVGAARGVARRVWLMAAAIAMGGGIWSMHFVAMLAFTMPIPMSYDIGLTTLSLVVAIFVTGVGFYVISRQGSSPLRLVFSGIFMGLGIAAMHYTGMAAMRGHAELSYDRLFVALSLIIAIGASTVALWLAFRTADLGQKLVAAVVMGLAVSGMHYTAMRAAIFTAHDPVHEAQVNASLDQTNLALAVAGITFVILAFASIASLFEQKRAEAALRQSESYLAEAQRLSHTGSWAWTPATGEIRYWSEECFRVLGFDPEGAPPRFETFFQRVHLDDQARITELLERATRDRTEFTLDYRIVHPGGRIRNIHVVGHPVFSTSGDLAEFVGTVIDVTERKRADEERQSHLWFLEGIDRINRAIQGTNDLEQMTSDVLDAVLSIFACDRAWLVYPCDPEAPSWRAAMEHTRPDCPGAFALGIDLPMDAEVANVFQTARGSSGAVQFGCKSERPVPVQLAERFGIQSLIGMAVYPKVDKPYMFGLHQCSYPRVWTAREERLFQEVGRRLGDALTGLLMLRNLRESEGRLEQAQRVAHVGYWERDLATSLIIWSDESSRIFGLAPGEGRVGFTEYQELIHSEDRQRIVAAVAEALGGGPRYDVEYRVVRPNGEVCIVHSQGDVVRDESGRPRRMFGIVQDITERKRAEESLRESERRYREAQMELAHVNRVATMGQLTASIAHEVSQPIAAAATSADAGLRWLAAQPPNLKEARDAFDHIIKAGNQAGEVIGRIRALIKKVPARKAILDINETILETIALTRSELRRHCILLQTELTNGLPGIWGDRVQLQQVILNLIMNAIEAMSEVNEGSRELLISTSVQTPDSVIVTVRDSGPGFKSDSFDRVFDPFYTTKPAGMGMGLSICRSIIEAHGGRLWATANAPQGAVFQFTLHPDDAS
jgi:PAS domain S-box-containing protein